MNDEEESVDTDIQVLEIKDDEEQVNIQIKLNIPKSLYNFILWYCYLANIPPSSFVYSLILHSLTELIYKNEWEDFSDVFKNMGVR